MRKTLLTVGVILSALIISGFAFGHMGGYRGYRGMMGSGMRGCDMMRGDLECPMMEDFASDIDYYLSNKAGLSLSNNQIKSLEAIRGTYQKEAIKKKAELQTMVLDLDNLLSREEIDLSKAKSLAIKIANVHADLQYRNIEASVKARHLLTEKQLEKINNTGEHLYEKEPPCGMHRY